MNSGIASYEYRSRIYERYASCFQDAGETFDVDAAQRWGRAYRWYFRNWLPADRNSSILDVACGNGKLLHFYRQMGFGEVSGVDISPEQVALARQTDARVHQQNVLEFLESNPGQFDLISGLDIVEHFHKDEVIRFLDGCFHALRPGGRLILQTPNAHTPWGTSMRYGDFTHEVSFHAASLTRLLQLCRFEDVQPRELGPVPWGYSLLSTARWAAWRIVRSALGMYQMIETGSFGNRVLTQVFAVSARKSAR